MELSESNHPCGRGWLFYVGINVHRGILHGEEEFSMEGELDFSGVT